MTKLEQSCFDADKVDKVKNMPEYCNMFKLTHMLSQTCGQIMRCRYITVKRVTVIWAKSMCTTNTITMVKACCNK